MRLSGQLPACPSDIQQALSKLETGQAGESGLYETAWKIAQWLEGIEDPHQNLLQALQSSLPPTSLSALLSVLADKEWPIYSDTLINQIAGLMYATDRNIAQMATLCLVSCCGALGYGLAKNAITQNPPHTTLLASLIILVEETGIMNHQNPTDPPQRYRSGH